MYITSDKENGILFVRTLDHALLIWPFQYLNFHATVHDFSFLNNLLSCLYISTNDRENFPYFCHMGKIRLNYSVFVKLQTLVAFITFNKGVWLP